MDMGAKLDVVEHAHVCEKLHILEGARNAKGSDSVGLEPGNVQAFKDNRPLFRPIKPVDAV